MTNTLRQAARAALLATAMLAAAPAMAQNATSTIRGDARSNPAATPGTVVTAVNVGTNETFRTTVGSGGTFSLNGLRPGTYDVRFGSAEPQRVTVGIGETASLDPPTASNAVAPSRAGEIVVTGRRLVEVKTSEIATNVSQEQIRSLPQTDRNFLSFARLAPGVNYIDSETNKGVQSGASTRSGVNVFIDGVSLKNQILDGGIAGQQDSRGNPFGQLAVQEFRVLTQNYKAEYEQADAAVITAVTKSGTNKFHGEAFAQYTDKHLAEQDYFSKRDGAPRPAFKRTQYGLALGGPIIQDRLFFFGTYEANRQDRAFNVRLGNRSSANLAQFGQFEGSFVSPFRGKFYFGKLTFVPNSANTVDLSYSKRKESDVQGFGGQTAFTAAENKKNTVDTFNAKWSMRGDNFVNQLDANYVKYIYNPTALNPDQPTLEYQGVVTIGGKDATQNLKQKGILIRDDLTYSGFSGHSIKIGAKFAAQKYDFTKNFQVQPHYVFRMDNRGTTTTTDDLDFSFPAEARLGLGNPRIKARNSQIGLYAQDDWAVSNKLELNLGLRWDYESNMFNNKYVTPANAAAALRSLPRTAYFNPDNYITNGHNRKPYLGMFQPRLGFSYDISGDRSTVIFGGYGRYFDRNVFNNTLDEQFRLQYTIGNFFFSRDGQPRNGNPTVVFNPSYLTREGLLALQATAQTGLPELFAVPNNARPPRTDQFSFGVRHRFGQWVASATGSYIKGVNGYTTLFATRNPDGSCCNTATARSFGYGNVLIGYNGLSTRYKALYLTLDKPYTRRSGWGFNAAYTLSKGEQNGNDLFSLDKPTPDLYGYRPRTGDERHKLVLSGMVDLPAGFRLSTLSQFGSGAAYQVFDARAGFDIGQTRIISQYPGKNCAGKLLAYCEVNFTLENNIKVVRGATLNVAVDFLNVFNNRNFTGFNGFVGPNDTLQTQTIGFSSLTLPRRIQLRVGARF